MLVTQAWGVRRPRRTHLLMALVMLTLNVGVLAQADRAEATMYHSGVDADRISVIGDSVSAGIRWYGQTAPLRRFNYTVDLESCRRTALASCRGREGYAPDNTIGAMRRLQGRLTPVLIVATGYNDPEYGFASAVDAVMAEAARQGIDIVIWQTMRETTSYTSPRGLSNAATFRANNRTLRAKAVQYGGRLRIADWSAYSANRPDWVAYDGAHLTRTGSYAMAGFMANQAAAALRDLRTPTPVVTATAPTPGIGSGSVRVAWGPPKHSRRPITDYVIRHSSDGGFTWRVVPEPVSTTRWVLVKGLDTTRDHLFRVASVSADGISPYAPAVRARPKLVLPNPPTTLATAVAPTSGLVSGMVRVTWVAPLSTGWLSVTDYVVQLSADGGASWQTFPDGVSTRRAVYLRDLIPGQTYRFRVAAVTAAGRGPFAGPVIGVPQSLPPAAPTALTAAVAPTAGVADDAALLSWSAPTYTGGPAISDYVISQSGDGGATWTTVDDGVSSARSFQVTGLTPGTTYQFRVAARTTIGTGDPSASVTATPPGATPAAPTTTTPPSTTTPPTSTTAPSTTAPSTTAPSTTAPSTTAPSTTAPATTAPTTTT